MKFIIGKKLQMSQVFKDDGNVVPVTIVVAGPCVISQIKKESTDTYSAVQIGFGESKKDIKSMAGHMKGLVQPKTIKEFRVDSSEIDSFERGQAITAGVFVEGDIVRVTGVSKGKGFAGVVKRHGFKGQPATHGTKDQLRMPGSSGATGPARVFKGKKNPGRMGGDQVTVANLEIVKVDAENGLLFIKGAVPGARNGELSIIGDGEMNLDDKGVKEVGEVKDLEETNASGEVKDVEATNGSGEVKDLEVTNGSGEGDKEKEAVSA